MSTEIHVLFHRTPEGPKPVRAYYSREEAVATVGDFIKTSAHLSLEENFWIVKTQLQENVHVGNQEHPAAG